MGFVERLVPVFEPPATLEDKVPARNHAPGFVLAALGTLFYRLFSDPLLFFEFMLAIVTFVGISGHVFVYTMLSCGIVLDVDEILEFKCSRCGKSQGEIAFWSGVDYTYLEHCLDPKCKYTKLCKAVKDQTKLP